MCVCMCMCMCVCMCVTMFVCVSVCIFVFVREHDCASMLSCVYACERAMMVVSTWVVVLLRAGPTPGFLLLSHYVFISFLGVWLPLFQSYGWCLLRKGHFSGSKKSLKKGRAYSVSDVPWPCLFCCFPLAHGQGEGIRRTDHHSGREPPSGHRAGHSV